MDNGYALSLNLAIWVGQEMEEILAAADLHLPAYQGNEAWLLPIPATFVVDNDGRVAARFVDPDYRNRMAVGELLAALKFCALEPRAPVLQTREAASDNNPLWTP